MYKFDFVEWGMNELMCEYKEKRIYCYKGLGNVVFRDGLEKLI